MSRRELTEKQEQVLTYLTGHVERHHEFPSFRSVQRALNYSSPNAVSRHIEALLKKGYVVRRGDEYALATQDYYLTAQEVRELRLHCRELIERLEALGLGSEEIGLNSFISRKRDAVDKLLPEPEST